MFCLEEKKDLRGHNIFEGHEIGNEGDVPLMLGRQYFGCPQSKIILGWEELEK